MMPGAGGSDSRMRLVAGTGIILAVVPLLGLACGQPAAPPPTTTPTSIQPLTAPVPPREIPTVRPTATNPESTEGRPWGQPLKKAEGAPLNLG